MATQQDLNNAKSNIDSASANLSLARQSLNNAPADRLASAAAVNRAEDALVASQTTYQTTYEDIGAQDTRNLASTATEPKSSPQPTLPAANDSPTGGEPPASTGQSLSAAAATAQATPQQPDVYTPENTNGYGEEDEEPDVPPDPESAPSEAPRVQDPYEVDGAAPVDEEEEGGAVGVPAPDAIIPGVTAQGNDSASTAQRRTEASTVAAPFEPAADWRVRISLAPEADYLYRAPPDEVGILAPLQDTNGVIFPYTPQISVTYAAHYDSQELTHSNYKPYVYKNSSVDQIAITADFTAQSTDEANYVLAVIHFFRSAAKMFYGQDTSPVRGTPPPLLYLSGYGAYQFDNHPMVLTSFNYSLPTDVDYISASITTNGAGSVNTASLSPNSPAVALTQVKQNPIQAFKSAAQRLLGSGLQTGAKPSAPRFTSSATINDATRVPTKIQLQLSFLPIITRDAMSNAFSLREYATGKLLRGSKNYTGTGGGIW